MARSLGSTYKHYVCSPVYIEKYGCPEHPDELHEHQLLDVSYQRQNKTWLFKSNSGNQPNPSKVLKVNHGEAILQLALAGAGIAQLNEFQIRNALQQNNSSKFLKIGIFMLLKNFMLSGLAMISMFLIAYVHSWIFGRACLYKLV